MRTPIIEAYMESGAFWEAVLAERVAHPPRWITGESPTSSDYSATLMLRLCRCAESCEEASIRAAIYKSANGFSDAVGATLDEKPVAAWAAQLATGTVHLTALQSLQIMWSVLVSPSTRTSWTTSTQATCT